MPESLIKRLQSNNQESSNPLEKAIAEATKLLIEKIAGSPKLGKNEAKSAAILLQNPYYAPFVKAYLNTKNLEKGEATKDYLNALEKISKGMSGIQQSRDKMAFLGIGRGKNE